MTRVSLEALGREDGPVVGVNVRVDAGGVFVEQGLDLSMEDAERFRDDLGEVIESNRRRIAERRRHLSFPDFPKGQRS